MRHLSMSVESCDEPSVAEALDVYVRKVTPFVRKFTFTWLGGRWHCRLRSVRVFPTLRSVQLRNVDICLSQLLEFATNSKLKFHLEDSISHSPDHDSDTTGSNRTIGADSSDIELPCPSLAV